MQLLLVNTNADVAINNKAAYAVPGDWSFINETYDLNEFYDLYAISCEGRWVNSVFALNSPLSFITPSDIYSFLSLTPSV